MLTVDKKIIVSRKEIIDRENFELERRKCPECKSELGCLFSIKDKGIFKRYRVYHYKCFDCRCEWEIEEKI